MFNLSSNVLGSPSNELLEYIWVGNIHSMNVQVFGRIHFWDVLVQFQFQKTIAFDDWIQVQSINWTIGVFVEFITRWFNPCQSPSIVNVHPLVLVSFLNPLQVLWIFARVYPLILHSFFNPLQVHLLLLDSFLSPLQVHPLPLDSFLNPLQVHLLVFNSFFSPLDFDKIHV